MTPALQRFLACDELDALAQQRQTLAELDADDTSAVLEVLYEWNEPLAVANVLMYPQLIEAAQRVRYLLAGLRDDHSYLQLAAIVGLQVLGRDNLRDSHRAEFVRLLVDKLEQEPAIIPQRASVTLVELIVADQLALLTRYLNHPDRVVRHNVVVAMVKAAGLEASRDQLDEALARALLSPESKAFAAERRAEIDRVIAAGGRRSDAFIASNLSAPLLGYIPNLSDW